MASAKVYAGREKRLKKVKEEHAKPKEALEIDNDFAGLHEKIQSEFQSLRQTKKNGKPKKPNTDRPASEKPSLKTKVDTRGKKRNSRGEIKVKEQGEDEEDNALEREVLALGGTNEDLQLLNGIDSDSEFEGIEPSPTKQHGKGGKDGGLQKGLSNILKEIALAQGGASESSESVQSSEAKEEVELVRSTPSKLEFASGSNTSALGSKGTKEMKSKFICEPRPDWYQVDESQIAATRDLKQKLPSKSLDELLAYATMLLDAENENFRRQSQSSSSQSFYNTVIASGTLSDKISALTLAVQESPVHNMKALGTLVSLAKKNSRAQAVEVLRALKDLFAQGSLLPSDRQLYAFASNPALLAAFGKAKSWKTGDKLPQNVKEARLIIWAFESRLKEQYFEVLKTLEIWCNDEIEFSKSRAISYVYELLKEKPEQESNLLRLLINKLGDPIKKLASQTSYLIMQLLGTHPAMKMTVISAIESDFMFRPGQSLHAKYYAVVTLNQTILTIQEDEVASKLLDIYFGLFVELLKPVKGDNVKAAEDPVNRGMRRRQKQGAAKHGPAKGESQDTELREKLVSAILTGINRAYPYSDKEGHNLESHLDTLFKITHSSNFNTSIQAMMLIQQLSVSHPASADRFSRTLYESLLDPRLVASSKQQLYLNLLHRSLQADLSAKRVKAFVKRIFQILSLHEPSFICGAFFLLSNLQKTFPSLKSLMNQPEDHEQDEEYFEDVVDDDDPSRHPSRRRPTAKPANDTDYDPRKRDPEHSHAENSCAWEVLPFLAHFHPSVIVSADNLLNSTPLSGKPDLNVHTLSHFLDRFVYRNPKLSTSGLRGRSIMQPMAADDNDAVLLSATNSRRQMPVNSEQFKAQTDQKVAADEVFFHRYFSSLGAAQTKKEIKKTRKRKDREGSGSEDEEEDEVWQAMVESAPQLEGEDDDEDLSMGDLESDFDDEDDVDGSGVELELDDVMGSDTDGEGEGDVEIGDYDDDVDAGAEVFEGVSGLDSDQSMDEKPANPSNKSRDHKKKLKALPTFASVSEYAKMLEDDSGEDLV